MTSLKFPSFLFALRDKILKRDCWKAQCEILQYRMLDGGPSDEQPLMMLTPIDLIFLGMVSLIM